MDISIVLKMDFVVTFLVLIHVMEEGAVLMENALVTLDILAQTVIHLAQLVVWIAQVLAVLHAVKVSIKTAVLADLATLAVRLAHQVAWIIVSLGQTFNSLITV